jgi:hypothetical protein
MRLIELAWAALALALIVVGAYTLLLGVGERARAEVSCGYVPKTIYEEGWTRECHLDGNVTVCVYRPTRYATTISIHTCVWKTYSPSTGSGLINILGGASAAIVGAAILIWVATQNASKQEKGSPEHEAYGHA